MMSGYTPSAVNGMSYGGNQWCIVEGEREIEIERLRERITLVRVIHLYLTKNN